VSANEALSKDAQTLVGAIVLDPQFSDDLYQHRSDIPKLRELLMSKGIENTDKLAKALNELDWDTAREVFKGFDIGPVNA
jgi:hypothetical protein